MMIIVKWFITALSLLAAAYLIPAIEVESFYIALIVAALLGLVNLVLRPILIFLTLPITILTLGLFTFVINGLLFWFIASFVDGFTITETGLKGFSIAILGALIVSVFSFIGNKILTESPVGGGNIPHARR